ncbi:luciferin sulfotransferase-like [Bradysia coprophila]|uniref:luciferin sulfotransferase-like n=1 Tax=Bradysia coprophila TaxID=38358 RepID=UPI00187DBF0E|nr:luciferin sulfotransferase-like [Bradysia coprophila]
MPIVCESYNGKTDTLKYRTVDKFIYAYPKPNPQTPLGSQWKFEPCFLPVKSQKYMEQIENFKVYPSDIWSITFPKSGSTWCQEMIWMLNNNLNFDQAKGTTAFERYSYVEFDIIFEDMDFNYLDEPDDDTAGPRHIKTHLPAGLLPKQLWTVKPKIIYTARGVKDLAISYYHHYVYMQGYEGSMEQFLNAFLDDKVFLSPYHGHVKDFWYLRNEENILFLTYEEMKSDLMAVLKKTAAFLGKSYPEEQLKQLVKHLSFDEMKKNFSADFSEEGAGGHSFMRKGKVGSYLEEMSVELIDKFDKWTKKYNELNATDILP